jgi:excisionase family DNA binding protein
MRQLELFWIPVSSAARLLGVSKSRVYQMIEEGKLRSQTMDATTLVEEASVTAEIARRDRVVRRAA